MAAVMSACLLSCAAMVVLGVSRPSGVVLAQDTGVETPATGTASGEGEAAAKEKEYTPPARRETFKRVVIAGLPPVLGASMEDLGLRLSSAGGVKLEPEWWRLNMACYSSKTEFNGKALAEKLGLVVVSDVADELILAPADNATARQAEARLFLLGLMNDTGKAGVWKQVGPTTSKSPRPAMATNIVRIVNGNVVTETRGPAKAENENEDSLFDATQIMKLEGTLDEEAVQLALGVTPEALARPMLHYRLSDFRVGPYNPVQPAGRNSYSSSFKYVEGGRAYNHESKYVITADVGLQRPNVPVGPEMDSELSAMSMLRMMGGQLWWGMARAFGISDYYGGWSDNSGQSGEKIAESAQYVCMLLEDFRLMGSQNVDQIAREAERIRGMKAAGADDAAVKAEARAFLLKTERTYRPMRVTWADRTALSMLQDAVDESGPVNQAKVTMSKMAADKFANHLKSKGAGAEWKFGNLSDYNLREFYGFDYSSFSIAPYNQYWMMIEAETDPAYVGCIVLLTNSNAPAELAFKCRIDPAAGTVSWLAGEPEQPEAILARKKEIFEAAKLLADGVVKAPNEAFDSRWIQSKLSPTPDKVWAHVSALDFEIVKVLPGVYRIHGQALSEVEAQSAVVDTVKGTVVWETAPPAEAAAPVDDEKPFYLD